MFDTLYIGTSGLLTNANGLRIVSNNLANVNTPGFKSSQLQFGALFEQGGGVLRNGADENHGTGVAATSTKLLFRAGTDQATGNALDLSINGNGMFTVKRDDQLLYTRDGEFSFNAENVLVNAAGDKVQGLNDQGQLTDISLDSLARSIPKATSTVKVTGVLSSLSVSPPVDAPLNGITVVDANGGSHSVNLTFKDLGGGSYTINVVDANGGTALGTGTVKFTAGSAVAGSNSLSFNYSTSGVSSFAVQLDFSALQNVPLTTSMAYTQDGYVAGVRTNQSIDANGVVTVNYSNGQTAKGPRIAMAEFQTESDLEQQSGGMFKKKQGAQIRHGYAGGDTYGSLVVGHREGSNVDLAEEFGNLILMQRGYQASSHVISTANDMIQQLFDMKGSR